MSEAPEYDHDGRETDGEDQRIDNDFAQKLWELIEPLIDLKDQHVAEHVARYSQDIARHVAAQIPQGDGSGGFEQERDQDGKLKFRFKRQKDSGEVRHKDYDKVFNALMRGVNTYLPGPPGVGKSHMAAQIAEELGREFAVDSFSPMTTESKLLGFMNAQGEYVRTAFRNAYEYGWLYCMDELDNTNGSVIAVMNGALANGVMQFPDGLVRKHEDFLCVATANTMGTGATAEFSGRQKLDPATLNRFVKIFIDTDEAMEDMLTAELIGDELAQSWLKKVRHVRRAVQDLRIGQFVTMRDSLNGAKLIAPGSGKSTMMQALEMTCLAVLTDDQRAKVKAWQG